MTDNGSSILGIWRVSRLKKVRPAYGFLCARTQPSTTPNKVPFIGQVEASWDGSVPLTWRSFRNIYPSLQQICFADKWPTGTPPGAGLCLFYSGWAAGFLYAYQPDASHRAMVVMFSNPKLKVSKHKTSPIFAQVHAHGPAGKRTVQSTLRRTFNLVRKERTPNYHKLIASQTSSANCCSSCRKLDLKYYSNTIYELSVLLCGCRIVPNLLSLNLDQA